MRAAPGDSGSESVAALYAAMVAAGEIDGDQAQADLARRFDDLSRRLAATDDRGPGGIWRRLAGASRKPVRGLYVYGEVGRGKTMLVDLFHSLAPVHAKRRGHYNEFMNDIHDRLHAARRDGETDPLVAVAKGIANEATLLTLDEFSVNDIGDAMILSRLFDALFANGVTLVASSNSAPEELYANGLNRALFLPFVADLRRACDVVALTGDTDYRLRKLTGREVYVTPLGAAAERVLDAAFRSLTGADCGEGKTLRVKGRGIRVPQAAAGVARFSFDDLCAAPLGATDYIAIARAFHTLVVDDIPLLRAEQRGIARRLILLIDTLYDHRVNLIASAAGQPLDLYRAPFGEEATAFKRTVSRLMEMRSLPYLASAHRTLADEADASQSLAPEHQSQ